MIELFGALWSRQMALFFEHKCGAGKQPSASLQVVKLLKRIGRRGQRKIIRSNRAVDRDHRHLDRDNTTRERLTHPKSNRSTRSPRAAELPQPPRRLAVHRT